MGSIDSHVQQLFHASIEVKIAAADTLPEMITEAGTRLTDSLLNNGKIFVCGNGGSLANALHFSTALLNHFEVERPALPVMTLGMDAALTTSLLQDGHAEHVFSRSLQALGHAGDILLLLSTSNQTMNLVHAVDAAHERGMDVIVLGGSKPGVLNNHLGPQDMEIAVPAESPACIREIHLFVLHCFCDLIDRALFGQTMG
ncbi:MAG: SIS domain-containing protein [Legionella sp.]|jgi:D-sedoheptulose 7-phosphate isomerase|nr:SIS domain-containing protein [Legionella sp.]